MTAPAQALSDGALRQFVRDGYVTVQTGLPRAFHEDVRRRLQEVFDEEGNPGNNILPRVPELQRVVDDPAVRGALTSILGPTFVAHPHRHCHLNLPGSEGQRLHKDTLDFSGDKQPPHHRPRWAIAFYYPQDVTDDMGPTGIAPGTQYFLERPDARAYPETTARGPAGTVTIVHFDIWHRGTPNRSATPRYMVKFEFGRMDEPAADGAGAAGRGPRRLPGGAVVVPRRLAARAPAGVLRGPAERPGAGRTGGAGRAGGSPARRGRGDPAGRGVRPGGRRGAGRGPAGRRPARRPGRRQALRRLRTERRRGAGGGGPERAGAGPGRGTARAAVDALGDMGSPAAPAAGLARALRDESPWVRRQAAEALGTIGTPAGGAVEALAGALRDETPFVRFNAATALARIGPPAAGAVPDLERTLGDPDRYARGWAALALRRIGTPEATGVLLDHLMMARWCPSTTPKSRY